MVFTSSKGALEAEQLSNSIQAFFLKHPVDYKYCPSNVKVVICKICTKNVKILQILYKYWSGGGRASSALHQDTETFRGGA